MPRPCRLILLLGLTVALLGASGTAALAATVGIVDGQLHYVAADDEVNDLTVTNPTAGTWDFVEAGTVVISPGTQCETVDSQHARCTGIANDTSVVVQLGDEDDVAKFAGPLPEGRLHGVSLSGHAGDDQLTGSPGDDSLLGDDGDDNLDGVGGNDSLLGGLGSDEQLGGDGIDSTVYYFEHGRTGPVNVTVGDNLANDGNATDDASANPMITALDLTDVENVTGSSAGGDHLVGDDRENSLRVDNILAAAGSTIEGGGGNDYVIGAEHGDTLTGGGGQDSIQGWGGNDHFHAAGDGAVDGVHCGDGVDDGDADAVDFVDNDCENITVGGGGGTPADTTPPALHISSPANGTAFPATQAVVQIAGTAGTAAGDISQVNVAVYETAVGGPMRADVVAQPDSNGSWSYAFSPPAPGSYVVEASQQDDSGNTAKKVTGFTLEAGARPPVTITQPADNSWLGGGDPATFSGTAAEGTVTALLEQLVGTAWQAVPTKPATRSGDVWTTTSESALAEGSYRVQASQAGASPSPVVTFRVDRTAPRVAWLAPADKSGTKDSTPLLRGSASDDPGDNGTVDIDFRMWNGRDWVNVPGYQPRLAAPRTGTGWALELATPLGPGTYYARAHLSDAAGNSAGGGLGAPIAFRVDLSAPRVSVEKPAGGTRLRDFTPLISGRASDNPGDAREVVVEYRRQISGSTYGTPRTFKTPRTGGTWSGTAPKLARGVYAIRAHLSDDVGHTATSLWNIVTVGALAAPRYTGKFKIVGTPKVHEVMSVRGTGYWKPDEAIEVTYRWQRCPDAAESDRCEYTTAPRPDTNYQVVRGDGGKHLRVRVSARNPDNEQWTRVWSRFSEEIAKPPLAPFLGSGGRPRISVPQSDVSVGDKLTAVDGDWQANPPATVTRQWRVCSAFTLWAACQDIRGETGRTYKVQPGDEWSKIELLVIATNPGGWNYAYSAKTEAVQGNREARKRAAVTESYLRVLGREPKGAEMDYWLGTGYTLDQMVATHQANVKTDRTVASDIMARAYQRVYGHDPYNYENDDVANQTAQFDADVKALMSTGGTFASVVDRLATELATQAYQKIFFWAAGVSRKSDLVEADVRNRDVSEFVAKVRRDAYSNTDKMTRGAALWTDVALSNAPLHGAAQTTYDSGADGAADRELCYGGVGPSCKGVDGLSFTSIVDRFTTKDGRKMAYVRLTTAVGSIAHDADCRSHPNEWNPNAGAWCGDYGKIGLDLIAETPGWKWFAPSAAEWNKATANTVQDRKWFEKYGPYSLTETKNSLVDKFADDWTDDLRPAPKQFRTMKLTHGGYIAGIGDFEEPWLWPGLEMRGSLRLEAPAGTYLDRTDPGYCKSHKFTDAWSIVPIGQRHYGICS